MNTMGRRRIVKGEEKSILLHARSGFNYLRDAGVTNGFGDRISKRRVPRGSRVLKKKSSTQGQ